MKLTNKTRQTRTVCFGVQELVLMPMETVEIPKSQIQNAKNAFKSDMWKRLFDTKVFSLDEQNSLTEDTVTELPPVEAPVELKRANKVGKGKAKITTKPTLDSTTNM